LSDSMLNKLRALILCLGSFLMVIMMQIGIMSVFNLVCTFFLGEGVLNNPVVNALRYIVYAVVLSVFLGFFYKNFVNEGSKYKEDYGKEVGASGITDFIKQCVLLVVLGISMQAFVYGLLNFVYTMMPDSEMLQSYGKLIDNINGSSTIIIFIYTMIFGPIVEELAFRGIIMGYAGRAFDIGWSIVIQAACFGLFHGNMIQGLYAFVLGCILGYVKYISGSMIKTILLHCVVNISGIFVVPVVAVLLSQLMESIAAYVAIAIISGGLLVICYYNRHVLKRGGTYGINQGDK